MMLRNDFSPQPLLSARTLEPLYLSSTKLFNLWPRSSIAVALSISEVLGYVDESGTHGASSTHTVMGGLVGDKDQWESFELCWFRILENAGLSEFHSKHYFGENRNALFEPKGVPQQLLRAISEHDLHPLLATLDNAEHKIRKQARLTTNSPYGDCFSKCLSEALCVVSK